MARSEGELISDYDCGNAERSSAQAIPDLQVLSHGAANMARDWAMLESGRLQARIYRWDGPWISLGRAQDPEGTLCGKTPWVHRPTGGSAVLHGHDLTVSIAMPLSRMPGVGGTYRLVTRPLLMALQQVGVSAGLAEDSLSESVGYYAHADCFASTSRNDIVDPVTGEKICGCALRRTRDGVLLQASIPVSKPLVDPASVIIGGVKTAITPIEAHDLESALHEAIHAIHSELCALAFS